MRKLALVLTLAVAIMLGGCAATKDSSVETKNNNRIEDEITANMEKFLHDGDTYTAKLFVEMADEYEG